MLCFDGFQITQASKYDKRYILCVQETEVDEYVVELFKRLSRMYDERKNWILAEFVWNFYPYIVLEPPFNYEISAILYLIKRYRENQKGVIYTNDWILAVNPHDKIISFAKERVIYCLLEKEFCENVGVYSARTKM